MKLLAVTAVLLCLFAPLKAQTPTSLAARLETLRTTSNLPAVGGVMFDSAKIGEVSVTGVRRLGDPTPATATDLWHIGSITKSFTSTLAGKFVERGQISWSSTVGDLIGMDRAKKFAPATLAQVLSHRAGLPANPSPADIIAMGTSQEPLPVQRREGIDRALSGDPLSAPGTTFLYSNLDYVLAGMILEGKTGKSWEELPQRSAGAAEADHCRLRCAGYKRCPDAATRTPSIRNFADAGRARPPRRQHSVFRACRHDAHVDLGHRSLGTGASAR